MSGWLILIHQLPPKPDYVRVKVGRRLQRIGAIALKNTVYVLPDTETTLEDLQWTAREIRQLGGEANVFRASLIDGTSDGDLQARFIAARESEYRPLLAEARRLRKKKSGTGAAELRKRAEAIRAIDYFGAPGAQALEAVLSELDREPRKKPPRTSENLKGKTWVTRAGIHIDRMASAWLVQRFVDPKAKFRFVAGNAYKRRRNEVRFDMFDAEFTHEGDRCTFEVMRDRLSLEDAALRAIGEIVHDIDLHDDKFGRPETAGVARMIDGIARTYRSDEERLGRAADVFDQLHRTYR